ncbi:MAG: DUF885 domain-containing protein [Proteobacteria bacterium]|nr:DUF885 domain-containing protein [Pseudomonadota bacterium]
MNKNSMFNKFILLGLLLIVGACDDDQSSEQDEGDEGVCETQLTSIEGIIQELNDLPFDEFLEESNKQLLLRNPELVTEMSLSQSFGIRDNKLDNISDAYIRQTYELVSEILDLLKQYNKDELNYQQQLSYDTYEWYLDDRVRQKEFMYHYYQISPTLSSIELYLFMFFEDMHPVSNRQNAEDYIARLKQVKNKLACLRENISLSRDAGIVPLRFMIENSIANIEEIEPGIAQSLPFYSAFEDKLADIDELSAAEEQDFLDQAEDAIEESVIPAYQSLTNTLSSLLSHAPTDDGVWQFPDGDKFYDYTLRHHTTTDMTADEIHELGLDEVQRIKKEMRDLFDQLNYPEDDSLSDLFGRVAVDGGFIDQSLVLSTYKEIIEQAEQNLDAAFDISPEAEVIVIGGYSGGYYMPASLDGSRPGAFYAYTQSDLPWYDMPSLTYHETVPGHHFQIAIAQEQDLPLFRVSEFTAYVEGWALYAELLAKELGFYDSDIYGDLGRLQYEMLRAVRLVVDTGMHAKQWTFNEAVNYMMENTGYSSVSAQNAIARYISWPAQATAYKIGMLKIRDLRTKAEDELGDLFDLKEFHSTVLLNGSVPLGVLESIVESFIKDK